MSELNRRELLRQAAGGSLAIAGGAAFVGCGSSSGDTTTAGGNPKPGGTLRIGMTGSASSDTFDPHLALTTSDFTRSELLFEGLVGVNANGGIRNILAEELSVDKEASEWTIRVHSGVDFHNGRELTADDVIYTLQRVADPKAPLIGAASIELLDVQKIKKVDKYTIRIPTLKPFAILDQVLAGGQFAGSTYYMILPKGFDLKSPVGTGPFKFKSFTPNQQTAVVKNENYWHKGLPYLDGVVVTSYADEASQVNALVAGQEDAINSVSIGSVPPIEGAGKQVLISDTGEWLPFVMRTDLDPLADVEVRQAMRLAVDRQQILDQVYGGHGVLGNDFFGIFTPEYDQSIPQREQDVEQAKSLLKSAGQEGLTVELTTAPISQGTVQVAEVFAQQAAAAGITVNLKKTTPTEIFGSNFLQLPFTQDFWLGLAYLPLVGLATYSKAPLNETHFNNPSYDELFNQAIGTVDAAKRKTLVHEMQRIDYDEGGYIIPFFAPVIDGVAPNVNGITATRSGLSLHDYNFTEVWLS